MMQLESYIDHTLLKQEAKEGDIQKLCDEATTYRFFSVCVRPEWVASAKLFLRSSSVKVVTVVDFPKGEGSLEHKVQETQSALKAGADEIDFVLNRTFLKARDLESSFREMKAIEEIASHKLIKVILETSELSKEEIVMACTLAKLAGVHFVKTSTGFSKSGATIEDIRLMRSVVGSSLGVKASGGVRTQDQAISFIEAGANRLGASASVAIVTGGNTSKGNY